MGMITGSRAEVSEEHIRLHTELWPAVLEALRSCNIRNHVMCHHAGLLLAHLEYHGEDWAADQRKMVADPITQAWWNLTDPMDASHLDDASFEMGRQLRDGGGHPARGGRLPQQQP